MVDEIEKKETGEVVLSGRGEVIKLLYKELFGREADTAGLEHYTKSEHPLEVVYLLLRSSDEAKNHRKSLEQVVLNKKCGVLPISLCMIVKNCEDSVYLPINSVKDIVSEVVVLDTGSSDGTVKKCEELGARVYKCEFSDFGSMKTLAAHLSRQEWVLFLDSDESILSEDVDKLRELICDDSVDIWKLPRKRWLELEMKTQLEEDVYPDWQARLFRNKLDIKYVRRVHEILVGSIKEKKSPEGPHIQHFQDSFKSGTRLKKRNEMYKRLHDLDISEGVEHEEPAFVEIDNVD